MARRANGEGTVRKRSDGRWEGRYFDKSTKKQKSVYGKTQIEAIKKLQYAQCVQGNQQFIEQNDILLEVWAQVWLDNYTSHLKPLTISSYRTIIKTHVNPKLGDVKLKELTTEMIQFFYNDKGKTLAPKTINNIHGCLHKCLQQAIDLHNHYLDSNPTEGCSIPIVEDYEFEPLENEDIQNLLSTIDITNIYDQISMVGLFTGMRQSEILGLRWKDVDLEYGTAYIKRQLQKDKVVHKEYNSKYFIGGSPKSKKNRTIDLAETIVEILKLRKKQQSENKRLNGNAWCGNEKINQDLIFTHPNGKHLAHCTVLKKYKKLLKRSGLTPNRFHDLRHSYAVISLQIGEDLKTIQINMGHHCEAFMLKKYGHITKGMRKNSAVLMQRYIDKQKEQEESRSDIGVAI